MDSNATGQTEKTPKIKKTTLADLVDTANNPHIDMLCDQLFHSSPRQSTDSHAPLVKGRRNR